ncbi:UV excision repair protein (RadW), putative [Penicillium digitatum]|uniref:UV excision repair protein RAD23 n=3 Tax=Penicillium digitatum TaxID=36651 RepID=K9FAG7_PEND2|nr:UV excision repair protein (RadW), putative [Penicillium digitatum Pd1]EKV05052.1 UV excision repair protein (RadW), putative [Penicillium digitatum PHI26]EKV19612.1 UV excision repair protein (RadW), putative [Penicillium digitatum Pd1]QQK45045.1 UV excision repair protein (RadW), putative [Penicillium digitatum]
MKLTFKDLKQEKFVIDVEPSETVREVKVKIAQEKGEYDAERMKVIYSGKILQDDKTVESYNIQEKDFLVCLPSKQPKAASSTAPQVPSTPAARAPVSTPAPPPAPHAAAAAPLFAAPATPSPAGAAPPPSSGPAFGDPSALTMGSAAEGAAAQMEAMGFARTDIDRAMRAAFYNPDRAIEYLLTGIPDNIQEQQQQQRQASEPASTGAAPAAPSGGDEPHFNLFEAAAQAGGEGGGRSRGVAGAGAGTAGGEALGSLEFLRSNPHFQQLRQLVQQQPHMLEPILQQVAAGNPQIASIIGQNSDQFLQLLGEELEDEEGALPPGAQAISVTEEERDAIERLCRLGFPRDSVIQAYFACDKNEELAANFLFDQPEEDEQ